MRDRGQEDVLVLLFKTRLVLQFLLRDINEDNDSHLGSKNCYILEQESISGLAIAQLVSLLFLSKCSMRYFSISLFCDGLI